MIPYSNIGIFVCVTEGIIYYDFGRQEIVSILILDEYDDFYE